MTVLRERRNNPQVLHLHAKISIIMTLLAIIAAMHVLPVNGTVLDVIAASPRKNYKLLTAALGNVSITGPDVFEFLHSPRSGKSEFAHFS